LTKITLKFKMKLRTLINFAHLFVVIEQGAYFLTGDKDLVKIVKENKIYDKIITYPELRKMLI